MFASHTMLVIQLGPRQTKSSAPNAFENLPSSSSLLLALILCLKLAVSLQIGILGQELGNSGTIHSSACDLLLLSASTNHSDSSLTNYCQCKDAETAIGEFGLLSDSKATPSISQAEAEAETTTSATITPTLPSLTRISQLNCSPANLTQLIQDLKTTMRQQSEASFKGRFQIDYLSVDTNIINLQANTNINHLDDLSSDSLGSLENQLFVDYISLQLGLLDLQTNSGQERVYRNNNESREENDYGVEGEEEGETNTPDQSAQYLASVEQQMIDFGRFVNELHLQSLSVRFISPNDEHDDNVSEKEGLARVTKRGNEASMVGGDIEPQLKKQTTIGRYEKQRKQQQRHSRLKLDKFLARYSNLIKLELSSANKHRSALEPVLFITPNTFKHQKQLKWLNLASNGKLKIEAAKVEKEFKGEAKSDSFSFNANYFSPFAASNNLEHLNLEWNGLEKFPIFSMLSIQQSSTKQMNSSLFSKQYQQLNFNQNCKALVSLTSLNLAGNKLSSFERDFFSSFEVKEGKNLLKNEVNTCFYETGTISNGNKHHYNAGSLNCPSKTFLLPSLSQLDLSYNKLTGFSPKVGQYLLCIMPNLSQLYLQHNKIFHVNLNSLLSFPAIWPHSTNDLNDGSSALNSLFLKGSKLLPAADTLPTTVFSRLEHIDLSYNCLIMIIASTSQQHHNTTTTSSSSKVTNNNPVRLKSIDLSNNNLKKPLSSFDINLIDHVIFEESFSDPFSTKNNNQSNIFEITNNFAQLEQNFLLVANNSPSTICDFLSPPSQYNVDLLNEVILTSNNLKIISRGDFLSKQCKDIQILRLSRNRISIIENEAFFSLINLEHLDLSHNNLNNLLENTFQENVKLRVLNLSHNKLKLLHKNTFSQLSNLEELLLNSNELFAFPNDLIANNQQLITLNLFENKISHLNQSLFANLKQLRSLNLHSNLLKYISQHLFQLAENNNSSISSRDEKHHVNQVTQKRINHNKNSQQTSSRNSKKFNNLKSKKASMKRRRQIIEDDYSPNLLILTSNQIELFEFENCSNFGRNIQILWLNNNLLNELKKSSFNCLIKVQKINLRSNRLKYIDGQAFSQLTQLEYIDLSDNELKQIQPNTFGFSIELHHIDLSSNQLRDINLLDAFRSSKDQNQFARVNTLKISENADLKIDISDFNNFLDTLSPKQVHVGHIGQIVGRGGVNNQNALLKLKNKLSIEIMNMSCIHQIDDQLFNILGDSSIVVEKLDLSSMNITPSNSLKLITVLLMRLKNELLELNISGNHHINEQILQLFNEITFETQLNSLDMSSNRLEVWPFDKKIANMLTNLQSLNLSKNKLRHFIKINLDGYNFTQLKVLNLSSNALIGLVENPTIEIKSLRIVMPNLRQVDLSNNRLAWIPADFFNDLNDLTLIKLDNNHLETFSAVLASSRLILDLSSNTKLKSIASSTHDIEDLEDTIEEEFDDLILFDDHSSSLPQVVCSSIYEFKFSYESQSQNSHLVVTSELEMIEDLSLFQDNDDKMRANDERCNDIMKMIYSIKLESISPNLNLNSINIDSQYKYLHLNLRKNNLNQILTNNEGNKNIIQLDMSDNRIQKIPNTLCSDLPKLRSLDLNNNFLKEYPYEIMSSCLKLGYLDLSFNKITSLTERVADCTNSALMVLKLQHNPIAYLNANAYDIKSSFNSLRFIDLRFNQLKYNQLLPFLGDSQSLLTVISDYKVPLQELNHVKAQIKVTNTSLFVDWHFKKINNNNNMISWRVLDDKLERINKSRAEIKYLDSHSPIRLCTLNADNWTEICTNFLHDDNQYKPGQSCLLIKRPKYLPSCYIQLTEPLVVLDKKNSSKTADSSHLISFKTDHNNSHLESKIDDDFVLTLIDSMKRNWLRFKDLDLNNYLSSISNIKGDSIWIQIDGKYPLYTLTIVKIAIVGGSLCIIGLLIAMFVLLTYLSTANNNTNLHGSPRSSSELTNITSDIDTSGSSTINKLSTLSNSQINSQSSLQQSNQACSMNTNSGSTSKDDTQLQTVLERKSQRQQQQQQQQYHSLDAGQLFQQQQACSTPSSSLAPSSVETAETLQAIDSIQSGSSAIPQYNVVNKDCVDQYSDLSRTNIYNNHHLNNNQVATVMRIVKSNSANFDTSNRQIGGGGGGESQNNNSQYGTANSRFLNQSTLRSKIRNLQEHHQHKHQVYPSFTTTLQGIPTGYYSSQDQFVYDYNIPQINHQFETTGGEGMGMRNVVNEVAIEHENNNSSTHLTHERITNNVNQQDLDPTTMSLLSINTAISNSFRSSASQQVSPAEPKSISIGINDQQSSNLCSYHRLARDQSTTNNEQLGQAANVILEQEEEQYPGNNLVILGTLPPPPPSRAIEELENNIVQYLPSSSSNQSSNFYNN